MEKPATTMAVSNKSDIVAYPNSKGIETHGIHNPVKTTKSPNGTINVGNEEDIRKLGNLSATTPLGGFITSKEFSIFDSSRMSHGAFGAASKKAGHQGAATNPKAIHVTIRRRPDGHTIIEPHRNITDEEETMIMNHPGLNIFKSISVRRN